ncbi:MAG: relaxase/mobilization nuclease domain-containing protein, partial [Geminicoccaceae bacterium]
MLGKIVSGSSFKGAALYHLHDKRLEGEKVRLTDDRVAWTETMNLRTSDPEKAWRIMVATAENQASLKKTAGMKMTGRKLTKPVYTYSLAWHPEQKPSQAEMLGAAKDTLKALGMEEHQALIVCHNDTAHPHVHVILNRVHPETGLAAKTSQDRLKLSRWAEAYERAGGKIYCEERVINNVRRDQGEFVKAESVPRQTFEIAEAVRPALNDNREIAERIKLEQKQKDAALNQHSREITARHKTALGELAT